MRRVFGSILSVASLAMGIMCNASADDHLRWRDDHLRYEGDFFANGLNLSISVSAFDLRENTSLGKTEVPIARVSVINQSDVAIGLPLTVNADGSQKSAHRHDISLILRLQTDGTHRVIASCKGPKQCWNADGLVAGGTAAQIFRMGKEASHNTQIQHTKKEHRQERERLLQEQLDEMAIEFQQRSLDEQMEMGRRSVQDMDVGPCTPQMRKDRVYPCQ